MSANNPINPAFPLDARVAGDHPDFHGLTKREYFAGLAMAQMAKEVRAECRGQHSVYGYHHYTKAAAASAVAYADALLAELEKPNAR